MKTTKPQLILARCGDTLYVYDDETKARVEQQIERRLLSGDCKTNGDGSREWIEDEMVVDTSKAGSDQYTWAKDGNRVLHHRIRHTFHKDGRHEQVLLKKIYKAFE